MSIVGLRAKSDVKEMSVECSPECRMPVDQSWSFFALFQTSRPQTEYARLSNLWVLVRQTTADLDRDNNNNNNKINVVDVAEDRRCGSWRRWQLVKRWRGKTTKGDAVERRRPKADVDGVETRAQGTVKTCTQHTHELDWTQLQYEQPQWSVTYVLRTSRALAVLLSLQSINTNQCSIKRVQQLKNVKLRFFRFWKTRSVCT